LSDLRQRNSFVGVVIPTRNRPDLVQRAVRSALAQTHRDLEVIVVIDGPDPLTISALKPWQLSDTRLRVLPLMDNVGGGDARNEGIRASKGDWIALLDDDDEWMAEKLEKQLTLALTSSYRFPVIACKMIGRTLATDHVWPTKEPTMPMGDFLLVRRSLFQGEGLLQSSMLVAPRELFQECPFKSGLRKHQDTDWMIRAFALAGVGLEFAPEPLSIWYIEDNRATMGASHDWNYSLDWANEIRPLISAQAYASFLLTWVSSAAAKQGDLKGFRTLLAEAFEKGDPRAIDLAIHCGKWLFPQSLRRFVRRGLHRRGRKLLVKEEHPSGYVRTAGQG
jgi:hypothetical protein